MKARTIIFCLYLGLTLVSSFDARAFLAHGPIELSVGVVVNAVNGVTIHECIEQQVVGRSGQVYLTLGVADDQSAPLTDWQEIYPSVFCVNNSQTQINSELTDKSTAPFLLASVQANWREEHQMEDERVLSLEVSIILERRDVSIEESPGMQRHEVKRILFFSEDRVAYIPVLLATGEELQALGVQDVFISLKAAVLKDQQDAIYGTLLVISGNDGAEVLLVGNHLVSSSSPTTISMGSLPTSIISTALLNPAALTCIVCKPAPRPVKTKFPFWSAVV
jgi:hypothetical protein